MKKSISILISISLGFSMITYAQEEEQGSAADLAKKLANPIASLIIVPFQNNTDFGIGDNLAAPKMSRAKFGVRAVMILLFPK